eukprot:scpid51810/ scgid7597/ 
MTHAKQRSDKLQSSMMHCGRRKSVWLTLMSDVKLLKKGKRKRNHGCDYDGNTGVAAAAVNATAIGSAVEKGVSVVALVDWPIPISGILACRTRSGWSGYYWTTLLATNTGTRFLLR